MANTTGLDSGAGAGVELIFGGAAMVADDMVGIGWNAFYVDELAGAGASLRYYVIPTLNFK